MSCLHYNLKVVMIMKNTASKRHKAGFNNPKLYLALHLSIILFLGIVFIRVVIDPQEIKEERLNQQISDKYFPNGRYMYQDEIADLDLFEYPDPIRPGQETSVDGQISSFMETNNLLENNVIVPGLYTIEYGSENNICFDLNLGSSSDELSINKIPFCEESSELTTSSLKNVAITQNSIISATHPFLTVKTETGTRYQSSDKIVEKRPQIKLIPQNEVYQLDMTEPSPGIYQVGPAFDSGLYEISTSTSGNVEMIDDGVVKVIDEGAGKKLIGYSGAEAESVEQGYKFKADPGDYLIIANNSTTVKQIN